jgi:endogenous inhibitor of DNA gyrase (YacG/DUF329 family)
MSSLPAGSAKSSCPICRRAFDPLSLADRSTLPFCGERCRQVDLCRWFDGRYAIASPITDPETLDEIVDRLERDESGASAGDE